MHKLSRTFKSLQHFNVSKLIIFRILSLNFLQYLKLILNFQFDIKQRFRSKVCTALQRTSLMDLTKVMINILLFLSRYWCCGKIAINTVWTLKLTCIYKLLNCTVKLPKSTKLFFYYEVLEFQMNPASFLVWMFPGNSENFSAFLLLFGPELAFF